MRRARCRSRCPGTGTARPSRSSPVLRQRRLSDVDTVVTSLASRGLTTGEIGAPFAEVYGAEVSRETISKIARLGAGGDGRLAGPAAGRGVPGGVHRSRGW